MIPSKSFLTGFQVLGMVTKILCANFACILAMNILLVFFSRYGNIKPSNCATQGTTALKIQPFIMASQTHSTLVCFLCSYTIVLFLALIFVPKLGQSVTLKSDILALRSLKRSIDPNSIPLSSYLYSWDFTVDPCESYGGKFLGVLCTLPLENSTSRVTEIDLDSSGYDGFLSPLIGNLTELTVLNLNRNSFRGPIPDTIVNLRKLTRLSLSENFFTGSLPGDIGVLANLKILDISKNKLSGPIPLKISALRSLTELSLASNTLSSKIPNLEGLWQLTILDLSSNQLFGGLPKLPTSLLTLSLGRNILSGHITPLGRLQNLRILDVSDNRLSGNINENILTLPHVFHVNVSSNRLTGIELTMLPGRDGQLQELDAHANQLRGRLPVNLVGIETLRYIDLSHNQLYGRIPAEYGARLGSWTNLYLDFNFLEGILPPEFTDGTVRIRGNLARNCLKCPTDIPMCRGGQKPASQCIQKDQEIVSE